MLSLANPYLRVDLLDPTGIEDAATLGQRFGWGGYIWQVYEHGRTPLLAGPQWPDPQPSPFNGQGLPEALRHRTRDGQPLTWSGSEGAAFGIGALRADADGTTHLTASCAWEIECTPHRAVFFTRDAVAGFSYSLRREIELAGRTLHSRTLLKNEGRSPIALQWFAHPFFPLVDGLASAVLPRGATLPENPGFTVQDGRLLQRRRFTGEKDGHFDVLQFDPAQPFQVRFAHPRLEYVDLIADFPPSEVVLWGNSNTFSIEPYLALRLAPGESRAWGLRYDFGRAKV
ncbi:hypothetical protein [Opitutus sp. ER46]|uniref:hypothetical protein n=1 Tax=Opitutus sp. ER46 TaxID=2161864 RepID=UPI000D2FF95C|nr:hypothetical protein [Opitutus sp. ER46]PTX94469.1 hypothetical protein DB354_12045 [Opitutus sp. ER46]